MQDVLPTTFKLTGDNKSNLYLPYIIPHCIHWHNLNQCLPTLFLEAHQQKTFWISPLPDLSISGLKEVTSDEKKKKCCQDNKAIDVNESSEH